jgi:hypothetical protein
MIQPNRNPPMSTEENKPKRGSGGGVQIGAGRPKKGTNSTAGRQMPEQTSDGLAGLVIISAAFLAGFIKAWLDK